jgi:hypothetical protein
MSFNIVAITVYDYFGLPFPDRTMTKRYHMVYLSRLSPDLLPTCVNGIVRVARQRNEAQQINSVLVFDGERFCQYLEGPPAAVIPLAGRIRDDARHTGFRLLHEGEFEGSARVSNKSLDYALSYEDNLACFEAVSGAAAVELLRGLLPTLDRAP